MGKKIQFQHKNDLYFLGESGLPEIIDFYNLDTQGEIHNLKLGKKHKEGLEDSGIGCFHGVLITPLGVYNLRTIRPSKECPTGQLITEISPEDFTVMPLARVGEGNYEKFLKRGEITPLRSNPNLGQRIILRLKGYEV